MILRTFTIMSALLSPLFEITSHHSMVSTDLHAHSTRQRGDVSSPRGGIVRVIEGWQANARLIAVSGGEERENQIKCNVRATVSACSRLRTPSLWFFLLVWLG